MPRPVTKGLVGWKVGLASEQRPESQNSCCALAPRLGEVSLFWIFRSLVHPPVAYSSFLSHLGASNRSCSAATTTRLGWQDKQAFSPTRRPPRPGQHRPTHPSWPRSVKTCLESSTSSRILSLTLSEMTRWTCLRLYANYTKPRYGKLTGTGCCRFAIVRKIVGTGKHRWSRLSSKRKWHRHSSTSHPATHQCPQQFRQTRR